MKHRTQNDLDAIELDKLHLVDVVVAGEIGQDASGARAHVDVRVDHEQLDETLDERVHVLFADGAVAQISESQQAVVEDTLVVAGLAEKLGVESLHGAILDQPVLGTHVQNFPTNSSQII